MMAAREAATLPSPTHIYPQRAAPTFVGPLCDLDGLSDEVSVASHPGAPAAAPSAAAAGRHASSAAGAGASARVSRRGEAGRHEPSAGRVSARSLTDRQTEGQTGGGAAAASRGDQRRGEEFPTAPTAKPTDNQKALYLNSQLKVKHYTFLNQSVALNKHWNTETLNESDYSALLIGVSLPEAPHTGQSSRGSVLRTAPEPGPSSSAHRQLPVHRSLP